MAWGQVRANVATQFNGALMPASDIVIKGAREHNLRSVDVVLPRNKLICLTGVSGSGKSSLAFDTLYAEGQRRYVESLSTFARQFLGQMPKPEVDHISGLSPSISISQKSSGNNPRSTVGTITEIYDFLRVLYARVGHGHCPQCGRPITAQTREQIIARILALPNGHAVRRARAGHSRPEGRIQGPVRGLAEAGLRAGPRRWPHRVAHRRSLARSPDAAQHRGRGRSADGGAERSRPAGGSGRHGAGDRAREASSSRRVRRSESEERRTSEPGRPGPSDDEARGRGRPGSLDVRTSVAPPARNPATSFSRRTSPAPSAASASRSRRRSCSASTARRACASRATGWASSSASIRNGSLPTPEKSFEQGCIELVGPWKDLGRWKRHIYRGVAETMERKLGLAEGTLLETPWRDLHAEAARHLAVGHRRRAHHVHLAGRQGGAEIRRHVRRPDSRAAGKIRHEQERAADSLSSNST